MQPLTPTSNQSESFSNPEDTLVRLSNGTPISAPGAIQADTQITKVRVQLATVDIGWKHKGTAINFEYYFRLLNDYSGQSYSYPPTLPPDTTNTRTCPCSKYLSARRCRQRLFLPHTTTIGYLRTLRRCNWSKWKWARIWRRLQLLPKEQSSVEVHI